MARIIVASSPRTAIHTVGAQLALFRFCSRTAVIANAVGKDREARVVASGIKGFRARTTIGAVSPVLAVVTPSVFAAVVTQAIVDPIAGVVAGWVQRFRAWAAVRTIVAIGAATAGGVLPTIVTAAVVRGVAGVVARFIHLLPRDGVHGNSCRTWTALGEDEADLGNRVVFGTSQRRVEVRLGHAAVSCYLERAVFRGDAMVRKKHREYGVARDVQPEL